MGQRWLNEWILGRVSGMGWWHHHQLGKEERAWDRDHRTHFLIFDHYQWRYYFINQKNRLIKQLQHPTPFHLSSLDVIYQTRSNVFHPISTHREASVENNETQPIFFFSFINFEMFGNTMDTLFSAPQTINNWQQIDGKVFEMASTKF